MSATTNDVTKEQQVFAEIEDTQIEITHLQQKLKALEQKWAIARHSAFANKYGLPCLAALREYEAHLDACSYQGGEGYDYWLRPLGSDACHWVVLPNKYNECQPSQLDRDAYYAVYGHHFTVPTVTHIERWGN